MNGSIKNYVYRDEDGGYDMLTISSQFKLNKGDTVSVSYYGNFTRFRAPISGASSNFFEGHLIRQINS